MKWVDGQIEGVAARPLGKHYDDRGWLAELFRSDEADADMRPAMGYVSVTRPGVTRGPHEHTEQTDYFCFAGPGNLEVVLWDRREASPTRGHRMKFVAGEDNPAILVVPPGVVHQYRNVAGHDAWVYNFPNRLYAGQGRREAVDEIRYEDRAAALFPTSD